MALVLKNRVQENSTTSGTGTLTLSGAVPGFQTFSAAIGNGNSTYYTIANVVTGEWEVGIGSYTSSTNTLSRTTVLASSNSGSAVNFTAGAKDVFVTYPAERTIMGLGGGQGAIQVNSTTVTASCTIATGTNGLSVGPITVNSGVAVTVSSGQRWVVI